MPKNGFIKLHKSLLNWEWYQNSNTVRVFLHLLLKANYSEKEWQGIKIKRGQFITSYEHLSKELGDISIMQVRTALNKLKLTGEITSKSNNLYTIITINNYSQYQGVNKLTNKRITNEQQLLKNNKEINKEYSVTPSIKIQEGMKSLKESLVQKGIIHESI